MTKFPNITYQIDTPDGRAVIQIVENPSNRDIIEHIFFTIGKAGSSVNAYCDALARMVVFAIKHKGLVTVLNELSSISSDRPPITTKDGLVIRSGVEALYIALLNWRNDSYSPYEPTEKLYTPPYLDVDNIQRS